MRAFEEQEQLFAREDLWGLSDPDAVSIDRALCALSVAALLQGVTGRDSDEGCALSLSTFERCVDRVGLDQGAGCVMYGDPAVMGRDGRHAIEHRS